VVVVFALSVVVGAVALILWVIVSSLSARPESRLTDPEERYGQTGRTVILAVLGIGLGGMSASFAGWSIAASLAAAVAGGAALAVSGRWLGIEGRP